MSAPTPTRCNECGTLAAEIVCHICKLPRPWFERVAPPRLSAECYDAQGLHAAQFRHEIRCKIGAGRYP